MALCRPQRKHLKRLPCVSERQGNKGDKKDRRPTKTDATTRKWRRKFIRRSWGKQTKKERWRGKWWKKQMALFRFLSLFNPTFTERKESFDWNKTLRVLGMPPQVLLEVRRKKFLHYIYLLKLWSSPESQFLSSVLLSCFISIWFYLLISIDLSKWMGSFIAEFADFTHWTLFLTWV